MLQFESDGELISCKDINCTDESHKAKLDILSRNLLSNITDAAYQSVPVSQVRRAKTTKSNKSSPGWKEFVAPLQETARFWYLVWLSAGKPQNTQLHKLMKTTKNRYHYQVRRCRRVEEFIRNSKMASNCLENDLDLFSEVKKQRKNLSNEEVTIDGVAGKDIPEKFAEVYSRLYNSAKDESKIEEVERKVNSLINKSEWSVVEGINSLTIQDALRKIKPDKSDPICEFSSDFLKNAPSLFHDHLASLIRSFLVHGYIPHFLLVATLVPIVKDKLGDICSSKNYRSIAISSLLLKLIDWIIIDKYGHLLETSDFQFGFQPASSTSLCSWMVFETIDSYLRKGSIVYGCLLDCTKAFDTVEHSQLFEKLLKAKIPPIVIRLLICIYRKQTAKVEWRGMYSKEFSIRNGVRQGAVISPLFFSYYMDSLFDILVKSGSGCHIDTYYAGCFGYADDLLLICPSRKGLQDMLDLAEIYVSKHNISFSTNPDLAKSKTKAIIFTRKKLKFVPTELRLNGNALPWVELASDSD